MASSNKVSFDRIRTVFYFGLLGLLGIAVLYIFRPFFYSIFWASVIAILFYPVHAWFKKHLKYPSITAIISVIFVIVTLLIPLAMLSVLVVYQSSDLYSAVSQNEFFVANEANASKLTAFLDNGFLSPYVEEIRTEWTAHITNFTRVVSTFLLSKLTVLTANILRFGFMLFIMLYTLYYFFKDGDKILSRLMHLSPLGDKYEKLLYTRFTSTVRATMKSTFIIGGIQGLVGGILFWIAGIQGAFVWGVIMVILSIVPAIGSFLVWLPAAAVMIALGNIWQGVLILVVGAVVISNIDNILRPKMIGKDIQMHPLIVLFSTLGGLAMFDISGFVIGPIIAALFLAILAIYDHYYKIELKNN